MHRRWSSSHLPLRPQYGVKDGCVDGVECGGIGREAGQSSRTHRARAQSVRGSRAVDLSHVRPLSPRAPVVMGRHETVYKGRILPSVHVPKSLPRCSSARQRSQSACGGDRGVSRGPPRCQTTSLSRGRGRGRLSDLSDVPDAPGVVVDGVYRPRGSGRARSVSNTRLKLRVPTRLEQRVRANTNQRPPRPSYPSSDGAGCMGLRGGTGGMLGVQIDRARVVQRLEVGPVQEGGTSYAGCGVSRGSVRERMGADRDDSGVFSLTAVAEGEGALEETGSVLEVLPPRRDIPGVPGPVAQSVVDNGIKLRDPYTPMVIDWVRGASEREQERQRRVMCGYTRPPHTLDDGAAWVPVKVLEVLWVTGNLRVVSLGSSLGKTVSDAQSFVIPTSCFIRASPGDLYVELSLDDVPFYDQSPRVPAPDTEVSESPGSPEVLDVDMDQCSESDTGPDLILQGVTLERLQMTQERLALHTPAIRPEILPPPPVPVPIQPARVARYASIVAGRVASLVGVPVSDLPDDCLQELMRPYESLDTACNIPIVYRPSDSIECRIGVREFQKRRTWLNEQMQLDPPTVTAVLRFQRLLDVVCDTIGLISAQSLFCAPDTLMALIDSVTSQLEGRCLTSIELPEKIEPELVEYSNATSVDWLNGRVTALLAVVRGRVQETLSECMTGWVHRNTEVSLVSQQTQALKAIVDTKTRIGEIQTVSVGKSDVRGREFAALLPQAGRLLRMLDVMVCAMLSRAVVRPSASVKEWMANSPVSTFCTDPFSVIHGQRLLYPVGQQPTSWQEVHSLNPTPLSSLLRLWPHRQGSHGPGDIPRYPICASVVSVHRVAGPGSVDLWVLDEALPERKRPPMTVMRTLSEWPCTYNPVTDSDSLRKHFVYSGLNTLSDTVETTDLAPMATAVSKLQMLRTYVGHLCGCQLGVGAERTQELVGYNGRAAVCASVSVTAAVGTKVNPQPPFAVHTVDRGQHLCEIPTLINEEWIVIEKYHFEVERLPLHAHMGLIVVHLDQVKTALRDRERQAIQSLRMQDTLLLKTMVESTLGGADALVDSLQRPIVVVEDWLALGDLIAQTKTATTQWEETIALIESVVGVVLSHGTFIDLDTHLKTVRLKVFLRSLPSLLISVAGKREMATKRQGDQMQALVWWMNSLVTSINSAFVGSLSLCDTTMHNIQTRGPEYKRYEDFSFLHRATDFPHSLHIYELLRPVEPFLNLVEERRGSDASLEPFDPTESAKTVYLSCVGMLLAFQRSVGLPIMPGDAKYRRMARDLADDMEEYTHVSECIPYTAYERPPLAELDLRYILSDLLDLSQRASDGCDLLASWYVRRQATGGEYVPIVKAVGNVELLYRCVQLSVASTETEVLLNDTCVEHVPIDTVQQHVEAVQQCLADMDTARAKCVSGGRETVDGVTEENYTFATRLREQLDALTPSVTLLMLLRTPSLRSRHFTAIFSLTGIPVCDLDQTTIGELLSKGGRDLDHVDVIRQVVEKSETEAAVENTITEMNKRLSGFRLVVDASPNLFKGVEIPSDFFSSLRCIYLYLQREVADRYPSEIQSKARKLEARVLWCLHGTSLIRYTMQYLSIGRHLIADTHVTFTQLLDRWYQLRRSWVPGSKSGSARVVDVCGDMGLPECLQSVLLRLVPLVRLFSRTSGVSTPARGRPSRQKKPRLCMLETHVPRPLSASHAPEASTAPLFNGVREGERLIRVPSSITFNVDALVVKSRPPASASDGDTSSVSIMAVVSGYVHGDWRTETLRLLHPVPLPNMVGLLPNLLREPIQLALKQGVESAIRQLTDNRMELFRESPFHVQFLALSYFIPHQIKETFMEKKGPEKLPARVKALCIQFAIPQATASPNPKMVLVCHLARSLIRQLVPKATGPLNTETLLSPLHISRVKFQRDGDLCVSALGAQVRRVNFDWPGCLHGIELACLQQGPPGRPGIAERGDMAPPRLPMVSVVPKAPALGSGACALPPLVASATSVPFAEPPDESSSTACDVNTLSALLSEGLSVGMCYSSGSPAFAMAPLLYQLSRVFSMTIVMVSHNPGEPVSHFAHRLSTAIADGHIVTLLGYERLSHDAAAMVHAIACSLKTGGELPYTESASLMFGGVCSETGLVKRGADTSKTGTRVGFLLMFLPVLSGGDSTIPADLPDHPFRYTDMRMPEAGHYPGGFIDKCSELNTLLRPTGMQLAPADLNRALDLGLEGDGEAQAVFRYLSVSAPPAAEEGLRVAVSTSMSGAVIGDPHTETDTILTSSGVYASRWLAHIVSAPEVTSVTVETPMVSGALVLIVSALKAAGIPFVLMNHPIKVMSYMDKMGSSRESGTPPSRLPVFVVDMNADPEGEAQSTMSDTYMCSNFNKLPPEAPKFIRVVRSARDMCVGSDTPPLIFNPAWLSHQSLCSQILTGLLGVSPSTTSSDMCSVFAGSLIRFSQLVVTRTSVQYLRLAMGIIAWQLLEMGLMTLTPVSASDHCVGLDGPAVKEFWGYDQVGESQGSTVFHNVGVSVRLSLGSEEVNALGGCFHVFFTAFAIVYTAFSLAAAVQGHDTDGMYYHMRRGVLRPRSLDVMAKSHPEMANRVHLKAVFPKNLKPRPFQPLRYSSFRMALEMYHMRTPNSESEQSRPRWFQRTVYTDPFLGMAHALSTCMLFAFSAAVNSDTVCGKSLLIDAAERLLPHCARVVRETIVECPLKPAMTCLQSELCLNGRGVMVPKRSSVLTLALDCVSTHSEFLTGSMLLQLLIARVGTTPRVQDDPSGLSGYQAEVSIDTEQDDHFAADRELVDMHGVSVILETHLSSEHLGSLPHMCLVFDASLLCGSECVDALLEGADWDPEASDRLRYRTGKAFTVCCKEYHVSPFTLLHNLRQLELVSSPANQSLKYICPRTIIDAALRSCSSSPASYPLVASSDQKFLQELQVVLGESLMESIEYLQGGVTAPESAEWKSLLKSILSRGMPSLQSGNLSPILLSRYPMEDVLSRLAALPAWTASYTVLSILKVEQWSMSNNLKAATCDDVINSVGEVPGAEAQCRVPAVQLQYRDADQYLVPAAFRALTTALQFSVTLQDLADSSFKAYQFKATRNAFQVLAGQGFTDGEPSDLLSDTSSSSTMSPERSQYSLFESPAGTRFGTISRRSSSTAPLDQGHTSYLPRLLVDLQVLKAGHLGVPEAHNTPLQSSVWDIMQLDQGERAASLCRLAILLALGLPPALAVPQVDKVAPPGTPIESCVAPYAVSPEGLVCSPICSKYQGDPGTSHFSRVLLHIPGQMMEEYPTMRLVFLSFRRGAFPSCLFSPGHMGQLLQVLGERYVMPHPSVRSLLDSLAQRLVVCCSGTASSGVFLGGSSVCCCPRESELVMAGLSQLQVETYSRRYLQEWPHGLGDNREAMIRGVCSSFKDMCRTRPRLGGKRDQHFKMCVSLTLAAYRASQQCVSVRKQIASDCGKWFGLFAASDQQDSCDRIAMLQTMTANNVLTSSIVDESIESLSLGTLVATLCQAPGSTDQDILDQAASHIPILGETEVILDCEDPQHNPSSANALAASLLSIACGAVSVSSHPIRPFLWMYLSLIPPVGRLMRAAVSACVYHSLVPESIIAFPGEGGFALAQWHMLWLGGHLDGLSLMESRKTTQREVGVAKRSLNLVEVNIDKGLEHTQAVLVKALEGPNALCFTLSRAHLWESNGGAVREVLSLYQGKATRTGQILQFGVDNVVRLKIPLHKRRFYICFPDGVEIGESSVMSSSLVCDCVSPLEDSHTLRLLGLIEASVSDGDGPICRAAYLENQYHTALQQAQTTLSLVQNALGALKEGDSAEGLASMGASLVALDNTTRECLTEMIGMFGEGNSCISSLVGQLNIQLGALVSSTQFFRSPQIRRLKNVDVVFSHLGSAIATALEGSVDEWESVLDPTRLLRQTILHVLSELLESNTAVEEYSAFLVLSGVLDLTISGQISRRSAKALMAISGGRFDVLSHLAEGLKLDTLHSLWDATIAEVCKRADYLLEPLTRCLELEAATDHLDGLCAGIFGVDNMLAFAIKISSDADSGVAVLSALVGKSQIRPLVFGDRDITTNMYLPAKVLGSCITDLAVLNHFVVVACLNPSAATMASGSYMLASPTGTVGIQLMLDKQRNDAAVATRRRAAGITGDVAALQSAISKLKVTEGVGVVVYPQNTDVLHVAQQAFEQSGDMPRWSDGSHMTGAGGTAPVQLIPLSLLENHSPQDALARIQGNGIVLVPYNTPRSSWPVVDALVRVSTLCVSLPPSVNPMVSAILSVPQPLIDSLSEYDTGMSSSPWCAPYVSPQFSDAMLRLLRGFVRTFGMHSDVLRSNCGNTQVQVSLLVQQIVALAHFLSRHSEESTLAFTNVPIRLVPRYPGTTSAPVWEGRQTDAWLGEGCARDSEELIHPIATIQSLGFGLSFRAPGSGAFYSSMGVQYMMREFEDYSLCLGALAASPLHEIVVEVPGNSHVFRKSDDQFSVGRLGLSHSGSGSTSGSRSAWFRSRSWYGTRSNTSEESGTQSIRGGVQLRVGAPKRTKRMLCKTVVNAIERSYDYGPEIVLAYPSERDYIMSSVPDSTFASFNSLEQLVLFHTPHSTQRCLLADFVSPLSLQVSRSSKGLRQFRDVLGQLFPPIGSTRHQNRDPVSDSGPMEMAVLGDGLDAPSYRFMQLCLPLLDRDSLFSVHDLLLRCPVSAWVSGEYGDITSLSLAAKRGVLSAMRVLHASEASSQLHHHKLQFSTSPIPGRGVCVALTVTMVGFVVSASGEDALTESHLLPSQSITLYAAVSTTGEMARCHTPLHVRRSPDGQDFIVPRVPIPLSPLSGVGEVPQTPRLPVNPTTSADDTNTVHMPVLLEGDTVGTVSLHTLVHRAYWYSTGAHFDIGL
ncbi:hypothetical protein KIPB_001967 [Kipferlia bialata]|uniref:Dynein heavy chain linker domain-containing protein n=1 Tax=Kipferlia bialata TaxID=797122 RepID=A0A9K3CR33_9EUKA|nr:hypothetical protein KIPB_001967 [Kipferlia bialata]|eukprot:g1967.t1